MDDPSTLEATKRFIQAIKTAPVLLLITFRPEFFPPWLDQPHVTMIQLNRLGRDTASAMIRDVAGDKELPAEVFEPIISKTDGVPLFVEELTKMVLESGLLQDAGDRYITVGPLPRLAFPTTLHDLLMARLDRLNAIKEIAQVGAAIGREFTYRLLAAVAPISGIALQSALGQLTRAGLIFERGEPPDSTYTFKHALLQEAAYASLLRGGARSCIATSPTRSKTNSPRWQRHSRSSWRIIWRKQGSPNGPSITCEKPGSVRTRVRPMRRQLGI